MSTLSAPYESPRESEGMRRQTIAAFSILVLVAANGLARGRLEISRDPADRTAIPPAAPAAAAPAVPADHAAYRKLAEANFEVPTREITATDFQLDVLGGGPTKLSSYRGKLVLLNFWATWCPSCREEIPSMERLYARLEKKGFTIVAVDLSEPRDVVKRFVAENKMTYPVLLDTSGDVGALYGARSIPTTYVIDRKGRILGRTIGSRAWDAPEVVSLFESLLAS